MSEKNRTASEGLEPIRLQQYRSPDKLNEYIRTATPAAWVGIIALALIVTALFIWGFTGTLPVHCPVRGIGIRLETAGDTATGEGKVNALMCFADPAKATARDLEGREASAVFRSGLRISGKTELLNPYPLSQEQIMDKLRSFGVGTEWIVSQIEQVPFMYLLVVNTYQEIDYTYYGELAEVSVITGEVPPYVFLIGGEK